MRPTQRLVMVCLCTVLAVPVVQAQETPATQPTPAPEVTPAPTSTPTTTPPPGMPPEPGSELDPAKPKVGSIDEEAQESEPETHWGIAARSYFTFVPTWLFNLFVEHSTPMTSVSFAGSVIRRKGNFDIQFTVEYGKFSPDNGLWQEKDEDPGMEGMYPDYNDFNLSMVSLDASFIWHVNLADFMQFRYGAGIGLGVKLGDAKQTDSTCDSNTTVDDLDNPNTPLCRPVTGSTTEIDIPPVVPVINLLLGFRFKVAEELSINLETGFRFPAFFAGGSIGYFF